MEAFILAGGQSRRFGEDKALCKIGKESVLERTVRIVRSVCPDVYLVVKDKSKYSFLDISILEDAVPFQSPIAGIYTALLNLRLEKALIVSVDLPLLKKEVLEILVSSYKEPATVFRIGKKLHPLVGIYSKELLPLLDDYIRRGERSVVGFLKEVSFNVVTEDIVLKVDPRLDSFLNMNTKEDLELVLERKGWT